ncbi:MAG: hypothetical protein O3A47_06150 [Chloroflexi bacterium]|nr:hypothetical protein [Chloroflexota bacterium]
MPVKYHEHWSSNTIIAIEIIRSAWTPHFQPIKTGAKSRGPRSEDASGFLTADADQRPVRAN